MTGCSCTLTLSLAALAAAAVLAQAQTAAATAAASQPASPVEDWIKEAKNPVSWLTWGGDLRIRNEYYDNSVTLSQAALPTAPLAGLRHEQDVVRFRGRVWASAVPVQDLSLNVRVSAEPREWMRPAFVKQYLGQTGMEWRYGILDVLNVKWTNIFQQPLSLTAGRQDIMLGDYYDWWLVLDGTPRDGSWSFFLDGLRLTYEAKNIKTKFDVMYIYQNALPGEWVPTIGRSTYQGGLTSDYPIADQLERGVVFYVSNKSIEKTQLDGYFIYKRDDRETFHVNGALSTPGDNADIYTVGGKLTGTPAEHWQYSLEGAYQFGTKQDTVRVATAPTFAERDIDAFGAKAKLTYLCKDERKNQLSLIGEFMSGDNPNTGKDEMFDVLWGRWPRWSELYLFSYIYETSGKIAQMNNLFRIGPAWSVAPTKDLTLTAMYNAMFAPESIPTRTPSAGADALFTKNGYFRGHYLQAILKYQLAKHATAHLWGEFVWQGDYYTRRDMLSFIRAEIMFMF
jgi:hypothetical protein